jgi:hypothetical protein
MPYAARQGFCKLCQKEFTFSRRKSQDLCSYACSLKWSWNKRPDSMARRVNQARRARAQIQKQWKDPKFRRLRSRSQREVIRKLLADPTSKFRTAPRHRRRQYIDRLGRTWEFKSDTELEAAQWFDAQQLTWQYETVLLRLRNGRTYVPDFFIEEWSGYVEVKVATGSWAAKGLAKVAQALREGHKVWLVRPPVAQSLDALVQQT